MNFRDEAIKKLQTEDKAAKFDLYGREIHGAVRNALEEFCNQDEEFAQAIVQGGTFEDCMKAVCTKVGKSISDLEAYQRAVSFYFPGAKIKFQMVIDLIGDAGDPEAESEAADSSLNEGTKGGLILDFTAFL